MVYSNFPVWDKMTFLGRLNARIGMIVGAFFTFGLTAAIGVPLLDQAINDNNREVSNLNNSLRGVYNSRNKAMNSRTQAGIKIYIKNEKFPIQLFSDSEILVWLS